ncbi:hypothetical protein AABB24_018490 [Solanum stoloniferum]|uniref:Flavonoid 3'-monooxygenase-like n=1 Tax=Solanum stoloniferum TaxID=62892 RepID=A0ABD2TC39_9SOLN
MEISFSSAFIALAWLLALAVISKVMNHILCPKRNVPPGPRPWPIIGNLNLIGSLPHESLHDLSQKYGDLMLLKFGSKPVLIASSPEMAKEILKTHDAIFTSRPALTAGKQIFLRDHLTEFTLSTISRMVMSSTYHRDESIENLQGMLDEWFILGGVINIGDWIPWLNWLDLQGYIKRMKALDKKLREFFKYVLEDHKAKGKEDSVPKDMVDVLLQLVDDPNLEVKITTDNLMGLILDLLAGGTDTSATTVEWAFQELVRNPNMIEKAHEELDRTIGKGRWVEEEDLSQLPYIEAIIKETYRLHPLTPLIPPHYSIEECNVVGYDIPKGTMVFVNIWSLGRNPNYWDRPQEFIPERFLENDINIKGKNFTMLPFGSGRRRCPGYNLGIKLVGTTLANLLHGFHWRLTGDINPEEISMKEIYGLTTHPEKPISMIVEPRFPLHLY